MKSTTRPFINCCFAAVLVGASPIASLTIYRIGGENLPPPELNGDHEFVQLSWAAFDPSRHGSAELMDAEADFIRPQFFDPNTNLTPLIKERGGEVLNLYWNGWRAHAEIDGFMFDGDLDTAFLGDGHWVHWPYVKALTFDLGAPLPLDRVRFYPRSKHLTDRFIETFRIGTNDGDPLKDGTREVTIAARQFALDFDILYDVTENTEPVIDLALPDTPVRRLLFWSIENNRGIWEIAEFEIYGNGFAPIARYVSNVIDLGAPASLGPLTWGGDVEAGAEVALSSRSGLDDDPNTYWRSTFRGGERTNLGVNGRPLNLASYNKLSLGARAGVTHDTENWAFWGSAYDFAANEGTMVGDGTRQYVQLRADFTSTKESSGRIDYVQFAVSIPPVASQALAEIAPVAAPAGEATFFTYKLKPIFAPGDLGFDSISIDTPAPVQSVEAVRISDASVGFEVVGLEDVGFTVKIPRVDAQMTAELIEIDFRAEIFKFGTVFSGRIFDSRQPGEVSQSITPGDADALEDSDRLSVDLKRLGERTIRKLRLSPRVFSPNGDGINDGVRIDAELLNLVGAVPVRVELFDLSGRSLGPVVEEVSASGRFSALWDGRDASGRAMVPGLYIVRLSVEADNGSDVRQHVVSLVY